ncbi:hypothetical protein LZ30DRAFT_246877 [Colletotrichum cereale]|nr:hypothetical protein LZ30DRAFT_246877 [Colletotrichum cereale]
MAKKRPWLFTLPLRIARPLLGTACDCLAIREQGRLLPRSQAECATSSSRRSFAHWGLQRAIELRCDLTCQAICRDNNILGGLDVPLGKGCASAPYTLGELGRLDRLT